MLGPMSAVVLLPSPLSSLSYESPRLNCASEISVGDRWGPGLVGGRASRS
jgi:hypothetical protein